MCNIFKHNYLYAMEKESEKNNMQIVVFKNVVKIKYLVKVDKTKFIINK